MLVENVMSPMGKLIIISPMSTVRDALKLMKVKGVRSIIVEKNGEDGAYGLVTFKNILQSIVAEDGDIDLLNVYDIAAMPAISVLTSCCCRLQVTMASFCESFVGY